MGSTELEFFQKQVESNITRASQGGFVLTSFLDEQKQAQINQCHPYDAQILFNGGFIHAEHKRALFLPKGVSFSDFKIIVYKIVYNKRYLTLHHRKILGALLNLGIKRESIGDIAYIDEEYYFACTKEIAPYIVESFKTISGIPITLDEVLKPLTMEQNLREETHILSSLRLDAVLASAYHLSRSAALEMITDGLVMINHLECKNTSKIIKENDIISVRHKGRFCLKRIEGQTRSERIKAILAFWV